MRKVIRSGWPLGVTAHVSYRPRAGSGGSSRCSRPRQWRSWSILRTRMQDEQAPADGSSTTSEAIVNVPSTSDVPAVSDSTSSEPADEVLSSSALWPIRTSALAGVPSTNVRPRHQGRDRRRARGRDRRRGPSPSQATRTTPMMAAATTRAAITPRPRYRIVLHLLRRLRRMPWFTQTQSWPKREEREIMKPTATREGGSAHCQERSSTARASFTSR